MMDNTRSYTCDNTCSYIVVKRNFRLCLKVQMLIIRRIIINCENNVDASTQLTGDNTDNALLF